MTQPRLGVPDLGIGVGLRVPHYRHILSQRPAMDFFEIISENFMVDGGKPLHHLEQFQERYPLIQHGVSLSIGGPEEPDPAYLARLKQLVRRVKPAWLSDHFCWCGVPGAHLHDLLPLPYTWEAVERVAERARRVQDYLEVPFALENTSSYMAYTSSQMSEWQFISEVAERANIGLMFDVNNVYVSAYNHGFDPHEFIRSVPHERIVQIHLAVHTNVGKYIIDTHRGHVVDAVWALYAETIRHTGPVSTLIEWDDEIPEWSVLAAEAEKARYTREVALGRVPAPLAAERAPERRAADAVDHGGHASHGGPRELAARESNSLAAVAE
ncbi:MAG: hypothetical protein RL033_4588 [Pseudomonadota bacterium]